MIQSTDDDTATIRRIDLPVPPTVLIVDDDELVLERLRELVSGSGSPVLTTTSGLKALTWLEASAASIVVTDLTMPGIEGLELCRRVRALDRRDYVYIILLTVNDEEKDILAGFEAGADDYISKRTSAAQFKARMRTANRILALEYNLKSALQKKHLLAMTDELTGVYNRRYFLRRLTVKLKKRRGVGGSLSILLVDIDHFKSVNDRYGHAAGDEVLKGLTQEITRCLRRPTDWCARLGGEEFVVVLEDTELGEAKACAERVRRSIANHPFGAPTDPIRVTVSIGVTGVDHVPDQEITEPLSLLALADRNLFASKGAGRNRVTWSNPNVAPNAADTPADMKGNHPHAKA
jgi:two-component system cell cycle response regulator